MLSTFLGILAIIGKILLVILCIILVLLALILLVPIRYHAVGNASDENFTVHARISWLLRILSVHVDFKRLKEGTQSTEIDLRIFGISPKRIKENRAAKKKAKKKARKKQRIEEIKQADPEEYERMRAEAKARKEAREAERCRREEEERERREQEQAERQRADAEAEAQKAAQRRPLRERMRERAVKNTRSGLSLFDRFLRAAVSAVKKAFWFLIGGVERMAVLPALIVERIAKIASKITGICDTIGQWTEFATDPQTIGALKVLKKRGIKVLKHVLPRSVSGDVAFGFEDPGTTGEVLAAASMFYPLYGGKIRLNPNFEEKVLEGELEATGRIRLGSVAVQALLILLSRDVRRTWKELKRLRAGEPEEVEEAA